jgi:hypothetical protein
MLLQPIAATASDSQLTDEVNSAPLDRSAIIGRRGFDLTAPFRPYAIDFTGRATVHGEEMDIFQLFLSNPADAVTPGSRGEYYAGYIRAAQVLYPLPIGSQLNPSTGAFTWQPGPGFVGAYDFVFVRRLGGEALARQEVRVVLNPKGSNRVGPQVVIDTPSGGADVSLPFVIAGWAVDLDAHAGSGVSTLHVWAYPDGGGAPLFVGATAYGGERPDVGAIFGGRFEQSGYSLTVRHLPAGSYRLAVFAWSNVVGGFIPARVVVVTVK